MCQVVLQFILIKVTSSIKQVLEQILNMCISKLLKSCGYSLSSSLSSNCRNYSDFCSLSEQDDISGPHHFCNATTGTA